MKIELVNNKGEDTEHFFAVLGVALGAGYGLFFAYQHKLGGLGYIGYCALFAVLGGYTGVFMDVIVPVKK